MLGAQILLPLVFANLVHGLQKVGLASYYFTGASALFLLLVAAAIRQIPLRSLQIAVVAVVLAFCLSRALALSTSEVGQWKQAIQYFESHAERGDGLAFSGAGVRPFQYYGRRPIEPILLTSYLTVLDNDFDHPIVRPTDRRRLAERLRAYRRLWVIFDDYQVFNRERLFRQWMEEERFRPDHERSFKGVTLMLFERVGLSGAPAWSDKAAQQETDYR